MPSGPADKTASDPAGYRRLLARHRQQIRELLTHYGPIDLLSLDMNFPDKELGFTEEFLATIKEARRLQPEVMFRNRGIGAYGG